MLSLGVAGRAFLVPGGQLDTVLFQDEGYPRRGLSAVSEIEPDLLLVKDRFLGLRVIIADLGNNTTRERVALRFLDDYPVHRGVSPAITLHTNREHGISLFNNSRIILA